MQKKRNSTGPSAGAVILVMILTVIVILVIAGFNLAKSQKENEKKKPTPDISTTVTPGVTGTGSNKPSQSGNNKFRGIIECVDAQSRSVQIFNTETGESGWLSYSGGTRVRDRYDKELVMEQLVPGDIVDVDWLSGENRATAVSMAKDIWEYAYQTGVVFLTQKSQIKNGAQTFSYTENLHVYNNGVSILAEDLAELDVLTLRGSGNECYVVTVNRGHGYLKLKEYKDYIGGSLMVNHEFASRIAENFRLMLPEGSYTIGVENDDLSATLNATICRGQDTVLDLTEYARIPEPAGYVTFKFKPEGTLLWIDDRETYYKDAIMLNYGTYRIRAEAGGYVPYEGTLVVKEAAMTVTISLPEAASEEPEPTPTSLPEETDKENTGDSGQNGNNENRDTSGDDSIEEDNEASETETDPAHRIIVYSNDGAEVYMDGVLVGKTEEGQLVLEKKIGTFSLEMVWNERRMSYMIQVDDNGEDFVLRRYFE